MTEQTKRHSRLSRRQALKLAAGAAGGLALAGLPGKWSKPVVKTGALPAHAAASGQHTLSCDADFISGGLPPFTSGVTISPPTSGISMHYAVTFGAGTPLAPIPASGTTTTTGGTGRATVDVSNNAPASNFTIVWSFTNPANGTGSCTQHIAYETV